ncbi:MAG: 50S ribosomal protein L3 [Gammaproteobacteria bacterium]
MAENSVALGFIGTKCGMTRVFMESGRSVPVTIIHVPDNKVVAHRSYRTRRAVQIGWGQERKHTNRAVKGQYSASGLTHMQGLKEFALPAGSADLEVGSLLTVAQFQEGDRVDVTGRSKGKGFAGTVKRWNFRTQDATHGNSLSHRAPGSIGQCQSPGKVWKGKKMAGQMGNAQVTVANLEVVQIDLEYSLLLVTGAVPGATGSQVLVKPSIKGKGRSFIKDDRPARMDGLQQPADANSKGEA